MQCWSDRFEGTRVTLWTADKAPEKARFFVMPQGKDDAAIRAEIAQELLGHLPLPSERILLKVDDVLVNDARLLRENDKVVVQLQVIKPIEPTVQEQLLSKADDATGPRQVIVSFCINKLTEVDVINCTVGLDFQLYLTWTDPDIAGMPIEKRPPYEDLWNPHVEINNDVDLEMLWALYPGFMQEADRGIVRYAARYRGHITNRMNLQNFPFDADNFGILIGPKSLNKKDVVFVVDEKKHGGLDEHGKPKPGDVVKEVYLDEWDLATTFLTLKDSPPSGSGAIYANAEFGGFIFRKVGFYFWKVMLVKMILIFSSFSVFSQDPADDFSNRQGHTFTLALTQVAFLYVVAQDLPKVSYLTLMDKIMLIGFTVLFACGLENWLVYVIAVKQEDRDLADAIDKWSLILLPIFYTVSMVYLSGVGMRHRSQKWAAIRKRSPLSPSSPAVTDVPEKQSSSSVPIKVQSASPWQQPPDLGESEKPSGPPSSSIPTIGQSDSPRQQPPKKPSEKSEAK